MAKVCNIPSIFPQATITFRCYNGDLMTRPILYPSLGQFLCASTYSIRFATSYQQANHGNSCVWGNHVRIHLGVNLGSRPRINLHPWLPLTWLTLLSLIFLPKHWLSSSDLTGCHVYSKLAYRITSDTRREVIAFPVANSIENTSLYEIPLAWCLPMSRKSIP